MRASLILGAMGLPFVVCLASPEVPPKEKSVAEDAVSVCTQHLQTIGQALDAYKHDHGDLPDHLSDLYPKYLTDKGIFHCPADASPGTAGSGFPDDPQMPISYFYEMNTQKRSDAGTQLGPHRLGAEDTWRQTRIAQRAHFGHRVPVVTCRHHKFPYLVLTERGEVYRSQGDWVNEPGTIAVVLDRMEHDLAQRPLRFSDVWSLGAVDEYVAAWIDFPMPPAIRHRLGAVADRLSAEAKAIPADSQGEAHRLAARLYRLAGRLRQGVAAAEESLRLSSDDVAATFLRADLRYRVNRRKGAPPVDALLKAEMARNHIPGVSVAVVLDGKAVLVKGYGLANVEMSVPATPDTVYEIGSLTKQFTAAGIMLLVEEGKIGLDARVSHYVPDLPRAWNEVTIRHLLTHTSGVPNYGGGDYAKLRGQDVTPSDIIKTVSDRPLDFHPGERHAYSNTNYTLLGMAIERVSGQPYGDFMTEHLFRPMGMTATRLDDLRAIIKNRASGYSWENNSLRNREYWSATHFYSSGGIVSTVMDLVKWQTLWSAGELLKKSSWEQM